MSQKVAGRPEHSQRVNRTKRHLLKRVTTATLGIENKHLQAAWDEHYLLTLLSQ